MTENQQSPKNSSAPLVLVLFVGFVLGVIVGFLTKDPIVKYLTMLKNTDIPVEVKVPTNQTEDEKKPVEGETKPIEGTTPATDEAKPAEETPAEDDAKPADEAPATE